MASLHSAAIWCDIYSKSHCWTVLCDPKPRQTKIHLWGITFQELRNYIPEAKGKEQTSFNLFWAQLIFFLLYTYYIIIIIIAEGETIACSPGVPLRVTQEPFVPPREWKIILGVVQSQPSTCGWGREDEPVRGRNFLLCVPVLLAYWASGDYKHCKFYLIS